MYIPNMAFLTYVAESGLTLGEQEKFTPEQLGMTDSSALAWGIIELLIHIITLYVMNLQTSRREQEGILHFFINFKYCKKNEESSFNFLISIFMNILVA